MSFNEAPKHFIDSNKYHDNYEDNITISGNFLDKF